MIEDLYDKVNAILAKQSALEKRLQNDGKNHTKQQENNWILFFFFFFAPKRDKPESKRHAIPSPGADFCRIVVMGESQIQDIVAKVLFFREY